MANIQDYLSEHKTVATGLAVLGLITVASQLLSFITVFSQTFILSGKSLSKFGAKRGAYAVITGATDGIGREFALQLAKAGFGVVLVSRSQGKLDELAREIADQYKVPTKVQAIDFSRPQPQSYAQLAQQLKGVEVGVLVNNVGRSHEMPTYFLDTPEEEMKEIVNINVHGTLDITREILPLMVEKKNGLILNIGSIAGAMGSPMLATYSGTKAFLISWSQALAEEYKSKGITVQLVNTYFVVSKMSKVRRPSMGTPTAKAYVKSVLSHIGLPCGAFAHPFVSTPYWSHSLMDYFITVANMPSLFISYTHSLHRSIRARALKKKAREAKQD
ncbi:NAD(P)-binding protein [Serendipita vermifera]|nr:NAD(P)-binding protein [Serendipita vermifera]